MITMTTQLASSFLLKSAQAESLCNFYVCFFVAGITKYKQVCCLPNMHPSFMLMKI